MIKSLIDLDETKVIKCGDVTGYIHKEHRFSLPLLHEAQLDSVIEIPSNLILFDRHHDMRPLFPEELKKVNEFYQKDTKYNLEDLVNFTNGLSSNDDNWVNVGFELGIINNVIIFGVHQTHDWKHGLNLYVDQRGKEHKIWMSHSLPGPSLGYQGELSDLAQDYQFKDLWNLLGWHIKPKKGFNFDPIGNNFLMDIDLDCFTMSWEDFIFPFDDEIFESWFLKESTYFTTSGWSGYKFFKELLDRSKLLTISREPDWCGGNKKCDKILKLVNKYLFKNELIVES